MRRSNRTIIPATCAILVLAACWPVLDLTVLPDAEAESGPPEAPQTMKKGDLFEELSRSRVEAILAEPVPEIDIQQQPLREVLADLQKVTGINMYFDEEELGDVIDPDVPITVEVEENSVTYNTLIKEFLLEPQDLRFVIRHNFLVIMSYDKYLGTGAAVQTVVYNCRDLLAGIPVRPADAAPVGVSDVQESFSDIGAREQQLIDLIRLMVRNEDYPWDDDAGKIQPFNGLLVIQTLPEVHDQVRQLLRLLRDSAKDKEWPADLGDWPRRKRTVPPQAEEEKKAKQEHRGIF